MVSSLPVSFGLLMLSAFGEGAAPRVLPAYTITDLGSVADLGPPAEIPEGGSTTAIAPHLNAKGQVVGWLMAGSRSRAFLWEDGRRDFLRPADVRSSAVGINDRGQILVFHLGPFSKAGFRIPGTKLGIFLLEGGNETALDLDYAHGLNNRGQVLGTKAIEGKNHLVVWEAGQLTDLNRLGAPEPVQSFGYSFNDRGQVVGIFDRVQDGKKVDWRGFLWAEGRVTVLGPRITPGTIDDRGHVAALDTAATPTQPFVWNAGARRDLGMLAGHRLPMVHAINARGDVVGSATRTTIGDSHAAIWKGGVPADLNDEIPAGSNWILKVAYDTNDRGEIVGTGQLDGQQHAFLLTPR